MVDPAARYKSVNNGSCSIQYSCNSEVKPGNVHEKFNGAIDSVKYSQRNRNFPAKILRKFMQMRICSVNQQKIGVTVLPFICIIVFVFFCRLIMSSPLMLRNFSVQIFRIYGCYLRRPPSELHSSVCAQELKWDPTPY